MNFFHHKDLGNHLLQLCPKVVKHPVLMHCERGGLQSIMLDYCAEVNFFLPERVPHREHLGLLANNGEVS